MHGFYHEYLLYGVSELLKCQSCDHSYLHEEWKARHGNTTVDFSRDPNMQSISLEVLLSDKDETILSLDRRHLLKLI